MRIWIGVGILVVASGCSQEPPDGPAEKSPQTTTTTPTVATTTSSTTTTSSSTSTTVAPVYTQVSAGKKITCVLDTDGTVACANSTSFVVPQPPSAVYTDVAAGWASACGVRDDGAIDCWGCGWINAPCSQIPAGNDWVHIEAGEDYFCAQNTTGNLRCWGSPYGPGPGANTVYTDFDVGMTGFIGLTADGRNDGDGESANIDQPLSIVAAGRSIACGVGLTDGQTYCWWIDPDDLPATGIVAIDSYDADVCWLDDQGHVGCVRNVPTLANSGFDPATEVFTRISTGEQHACALTTDGRALCWPQNGRAETSMPTLPPL